MNNNHFESVDLIGEDNYGKHRPNHVLVSVQEISAVTLVV